MAEVDTSSYLKPAALPVQKSALDQMQQYQQLESGNQTITRQKLENVDKALGFMTRAMGSVGPNASKEEYAAVAQNAVKMGLVPEPMLATYMERLTKAKDAPSFYKEFMTAAMDHKAQLDQHLGTPASANDAANIYGGVQKSALQGGGFQPSTSMAIQVPPTQEIQNPDMSKRLVGPSGPPGVVPVPQARPQLPVAPAVTGPVGPTVDKTPVTPTTFANRFPTAAAPGVAQAVQTVGEQSGKDYAVDLSRAKNYQTDLYPAMAALEGIKELGTQGVGPGTEPLNNLKSALITWLPNASKDDIDKVGKFEETRKYLTQIARSSGATGTNDQLAAAFEANPSIKLSNAATENVLKSVIALRKMQHAQTLLFGQQGLNPSEYSQWISKNQNVLDPRAFGFDIMNAEAKNKLLEGMATKDKAGNWIAKKGKEKEFQKFETSLSFANDAGLIEPPGRK